MKFTKIQPNTFNELQVNAGVLVKTFDPATGTLNEEDIITSTTGGITINAKPSYTDFGDDIDNCPKNTKELKRKDNIEVSVSCTALNINKDTLMFALGAADEDATSGAIVTRVDLKQTDFKTIWFIGDLANDGYIAIKLIDALSTDGFSLKTSDKGKGNISLTLTAHMSLANQTKEPVEFYLGQPDGAVSITLNKHAVELVKDGTETLVATTVPDGETVSWSSSDTSVATVTSGGVVTAQAEGVCVIIATITVEGVSRIDSCEVTVTAAEESEG